MELLQLLLEPDQTHKKLYFFNKKGKQVKESMLFFHQTDE